MVMVMVVMLFLLPLRIESLVEVAAAGTAQRGGTGRSADTCPPAAAAVAYRREVCRC
jgi:hypothetical protein